MKNSSAPGSSFAALILASGLSERMGRPKALLPWDASSTFLEKLIREYLAAGCGRVICTVNRHILPFCESMEPHPMVKFVLNPHPERGRFHSVQLGLSALKDQSFCFVQNVDNPFIDSTIIHAIGRHADQSSWCSPEFNGAGGHPVLLPRQIFRHISERNEPAVTLHDILKLFPCRKVVVASDVILRNINSPEDYDQFLKRSPGCSSHR